MNTTRTNSSTKSNKETSPTVGGEFPPLRDDRRVLALETSQHELSICLTHDGEIDFDLTLTKRGRMKRRRLLFARTYRRTDSEKHRQSPESQVDWDDLEYEYDADEFLDEVE